MRMTTTFSRLKLAGACGQEVGCDAGYDKLSKFLGGADNFGKDKEINLLTILESNELDDALWCLRATVQDCDLEKRLIAAEFAESVLHIFEEKRPNDDRPRKAVESAKKFANGGISEEEFRIVRRAADDAAAAADADYAYAAYSAAVAGAYAAADDACDAYEAYAAAAYAAYAYAYADTARKKKIEQLTKIFRKYLQD